jgi:hypothetical protein
MGQATKIVRDVLLALVVLALIFLNFTHITSDLRAGSNMALDLSSIAADSFCGDLHPADHQDHSPVCHACRIGGAADLPPAPCLATPAFAETVAVAFVEPHEVVPQAFAVSPLTPRAPPIA